MKIKRYTSEIKLAKAFNKYFIDVAPNVDRKPIVSSANNDLEKRNLSAIIKKYKTNLSIIAIEKYLKCLAKNCLTSVNPRYNKEKTTEQTKYR